MSPSTIFLSLDSCAPLVSLPSDFSLSRCLLCSRLFLESRFSFSSAPTNRFQRFSVSQSLVPTDFLAVCGQVRLVCDCSASVLGLGTKASSFPRSALGIAEFPLDSFIVMCERASCPCSTRSPSPVLTGEAPVKDFLFSIHIFVCCK
jgi:hypothetical protein